MAGGKGSRLAPMTNVINKHLLPVFDKPMIFYPLTTLLAAGIKEIIIITNPDDRPSFEKLLGNGADFNCSIRFLEQLTPSGIPQGLEIASPYCYGHKIAMILGDNLLIGTGLGRDLQQYTEIVGCHIFGAKVINPGAYGVVHLNEKGSVTKLIEKPTNFDSDIAIPGLYFFDESSIDRASMLSPSERGEIEIIDLLNSYLNEHKLQINLLQRGAAWLDCGTPQQLQDASEMIRVLQERQGLFYGNPKDILSTQ